MAEDGTLWGYEWQHSGSENPRPSHKALNGWAAPADDPRWAQIGTPPIGHNCACRRFPVTHWDARRRKLDPAPPTPVVNEGPGAGKDAIEVLDTVPGERFGRSDWDTLNRPLLNPSYNLPQSKYVGPAPDPAAAKSIPVPPKGPLKQPEGLPKPAPKPVAPAQPGTAGLPTGTPPSDSLPDAPPWPDDFPDVTIHTNVKSLKSAALRPGEVLDSEGRSPLYIAAKGGDPRAAAEVVRAVVKEDRVQRLAEMFPEAAVVPVHAVEATGKNQIPMLYGRYVSESAGLSLEDRIAQTNVVKHTGASAIERLGRAPVFDGPVIRGQDYIIVDDVTTSGSSLTALRNNIESKGGKVRAATTLATTSSPQTGYGGILAIKMETLATLRKKFDVDALDALLSEHGIAKSTAHLSNSQGKYLLGFKDVDSIRNRLAQG